MSASFVLSLLQWGVTMLIPCHRTFCRCYCSTVLQCNVTVLPCYNVVLLFCRCYSAVLQDPHRLGRGAVTGGVVRWIQPVGASCVQLFPGGRRSHAVLSAAHTGTGENIYYGSVVYIRKCHVFANKVNVTNVGCRDYINDFS